MRDAQGLSRPCAKVVVAEVFNRHEMDGEGKVFPEPLTFKFKNVEIDTEEG
jgi:hypothetical protein